MDFSETVMIERVCLDEDSKGPLPATWREGRTIFTSACILNGDYATLHFQLQLGVIWSLKSMTLLKSLVRPFGVWRNRK